MLPPVLRVTLQLGSANPPQFNDTISKRGQSRLSLLGNLSRCS
jgi:hypothetical protein